MSPLIHKPILDKLTVLPLGETEAKYTERAEKTSLSWPRKGRQYQDCGARVLVGALIRNLTRFSPTEARPFRLSCFRPGVGARCGEASNALSRATPRKDRPTFHPVARRANCLRGIAQDGAAEVMTNAPSNESQRHACAGLAKPFVLAGRGKIAILHRYHPWGTFA